MLKGKQQFKKYFNNGFSIISVHHSVMNKYFKLRVRFQLFDNFTKNITYYLSTENLNYKRS